MSNEIKNYYEGMFVTKGGGGEDAWDQSRSAVKDVLEDYEAEIDYVENWADQQFEKEIEKQRRGKYVLTYFQADPSVIQNIKEDTQMNERILRVLILNREKETTYRDMIQERIEANKEEEEDEEEEEETEEGEETEEDVGAEEVDSDEAGEDVEEDELEEPVDVGAETDLGEVDPETVDLDGADESDETTDDQDEEEEEAQDEAKTEAGVDES